VVDFGGEDADQFELCSVLYAHKGVLAVFNGANLGPVGVLAGEGDVAPAAPQELHAVGLKVMFDKG